MESITLEPIGIIHSPHTCIEGMPVQPTGAIGIEAYVVLEEKYAEGLKDLEGFSHIILIYQFHKVEGYVLQLIPFMDTKSHGVFATRAPKRPNKIGISIVPLKRIEGNIVYFEKADMLDGTPVIDIKPFYPKYDNQMDVKIGWLAETKPVDISQLRSDDRFK
ncbi:tRNA (N6-threonylcarbamoyladenosine(37)-N6)-methyltransferase TrmO [uncultured Bacteroides sp.]|uniref:tRNA (N6-threonylcarbamoyladenosine(37)-N6)-methyltransferase TrmO n=1 Tax=uncultured Bacteroides sp. TaxID=162156 RepID=UPI002AA670AD|nr:tRNA (N6-threonylcarbamoyladenosine(37)-N6)-methyltransferase TrmO [uncultured Bacteroides sp.]